MAGQRHVCVPAAGLIAAVQPKGSKDALMLVSSATSGETSREAVELNAIAAKAKRWKAKRRKMQAALGPGPRGPRGCPGLRWAVHVLVLQDDGGVLAAAITCASLAYCASVE